MASTSSPAAASFLAAPFSPSSSSNAKSNRLSLGHRPSVLTLHRSRLGSVSIPFATGQGGFRGISRNDTPEGRSAAGRKSKISDEWGEKSEPETEAPSAADPPKDEDEWGKDPGAENSLRVTDEWGEKAEPEVEAPAEPDPPKDEDEWGGDNSGTARYISAEGSAAGTENVLSVTDEWGEKTEQEVEAPAEPDPPKDEDEWGGDSGSAAAYLLDEGSADDELEDLKRCLVDSLYGTNFGLRASAEDRAEILELVSQLESKNPTAAPVEAPELLDGNWILLYTASSELLPLLAIGGTPFLKVKEISQAINTKDMTIVNATTLSTPFANLSFGASATFEIRSPSRIQVKFTEGSFQPPEISSTVDLPENVDVFGQKIDLKPVQQMLNPIQEAVANFLRAISGQPPLKVSLNANNAESWLLTTYLDMDFRISRGDGGLFVLAKERSPFLDLLS